MSESQIQQESRGNPSELRVWLVHDWLTGFRGGEKVLLELVRMFPRSRIATLVHVPGATHAEIDQRVERVSFLNRMPGVKTGWRNYLPLYPRAIRSLELDGDCDVVISVSHAVAKGVRVPKGVPHVCYCLTPMRYIWGMERQYVSRGSWKLAALGVVKPYLRGFDRRNEGVTEFVTLSQTVAGRIRRTYGREAAVAYPGIDEFFYTPPTESGKREDFYLMVGAMVGYKRVDLAVEAFRAMPGKRLVVIGTGPEEKRLRATAGRNVEFLGRQSDEVVRDHYRRCAAFVFPGEEDFGLTVVEAQACGAPVIAHGAGGATETVVDGVTGIFLGEQTAAGLCAAIEKFEGMKFEESACLENAMQFTWAGYREGMCGVVAEMVRPKAKE